MPSSSSSALVPSHPNPYPYPLDDGEESAPSLSLRDFLAILRRRKAIALNIFVLVVALGVGITLLTKPTYRTSARLLVQGSSRSLSIANDSNPFSSVFQGKPGRDIDTQIEVLRSSEVLNRVYQAAGLAPGTVNVDVRRVQQTDVIELTVTSTSKEAAEKFATAMPQVYQQDTRSDLLREVTAALNFAQNSLEEESGKLNRTESALGKYNKAKNVTGDSSEVSGAIEAAAQSRADLVKIESNVASLQAQLAALQQQRSGLAPALETPVTTTNPQLQVLRDQIASLGSDRARLLFLYKPGDDEVRKVDAQIRDLQNRLARTPATITNVSRAPNPSVDALEAKIGDTSAQINAARSSLGPLRQQLASQTSRLSGFSSIQLQQAQLLRDREISAQASKSLSQSVLQLTLKQKALEAAGAPVTIMEPAGPALQIAPRPSRNIVMALFLGALLAAGAALLQESLDDHIRDEDEARRLLGTPVLGFFPQLPPERQRPLLNLENPDRILLENFRVLRSNVQFTLINTPGRKLQVTSSVPGEGKSYVASNLAIAMALDGRRVILVDADLHRPTMHTVFEAQRQPGLTNVLAGSVKLLDSLQDVGVAGLRLLSAGASPPNPVELLNSPAMAAVIEMLESEADVVIFDTPPLLATADSQVMSSKVDGVIYVMQLGRVPRSAVQRSFELLQQAGARVAGVVFNKVEEQQRTTSYGSYYYEPNEDSEAGAATPIRTGDPGGEGVGALLKSAKRFLPSPRSAESNLKSVAESGETNGAANGASHQNTSLVNGDASQAEPSQAEPSHETVATKSESGNPTQGD